MKATLPNKKGNFNDSEWLTKKYYLLLEASADRGE